MLHVVFFDDTVPINMTKLCMSIEIIMCIHSRTFGVMVFLVSISLLGEAKGSSCKMSVWVWLWVCSFRWLTGRFYLWCL